MTPPLVSVVTPCYNAAPFVAETIESVLAQTHPSVEQIVVDDASTDGSWEVIERYVALHPGQVRGVRLEANRGGSHARNRGAELARGEMVMFLDADDTIEPDTLAALARAAEGEPGSISFCPWVRWKLGGSGAWTAAPADVPLPSHDPAEALRGWLTGAAWAPPCAILWTRAAYERTGGWDEDLTLNDDGDLMMRALAGGARLVPSGGGMARYRTHQAARMSVSQTFLQESKLRSQVRTLEKVRAALAAQGRLAEFAEALGVGYQLAAYSGFKSGHLELARECLRTGEEFAGRRAVAPTRVGRLLVRVLGMERKERLAQLLARAGMMTPQRRSLARLRRMQAEQAGGP